MTLPSASESRSFYQAAQQRLRDAKFLMDGKRTTAAVYMAGYSVECVLKALILELASPKERVEVVRSFRGSKAHDFAWLRWGYVNRGGPQMPREVSAQFTLVRTWSTDLRYKPGTINQRDALAFMNAATAIFTWADGRL